MTTLKTHLTTPLKHNWGGGAAVSLIEMVGIFNLAKMMVSVHLNELECEVEKPITTSWRSYRRGSKTNLNFQPVNKPSWVSPHEVLQSRLISIVYHLSVNNNNNSIKGYGGGLINFLPLKREGLLERGDLIEDLV